MHKFKLGQKVKDRIHGLEGICTARLEYINGCIQYGIASKAIDGKVPDTNYIDQQHLELVDDGVLEHYTKPTFKNPNGGPSSNKPL